MRLRTKFFLVMGACVLVAVLATTLALARFFTADQEAYLTDLQSNLGRFAERELSQQMELWYAQLAALMESQSLTSEAFGELLPEAKRAEHWVGDRSLLIVGTPVPLPSSPPLGTSRWALSPSPYEPSWVRWVGRYGARTVTLEVAASYFEGLLETSHGVSAFLIEENSRAIFMTSALKTPLTLKSGELEIGSGPTRKISRTSRIHLNTEPFLATLIPLATEPPVTLVLASPIATIDSVIARTFRQSLSIAGLSIFFTLSAGILLASTLTRRLRRLASRIQLVAQGQFDIPFFEEERSANAETIGDEVRQVSASFCRMTEKLKALMREMEDKLRMENELKTAQWVQNTLLDPHPFVGEHLTVATHYSPASECAGDFWDIRRDGHWYWLAVGDATGHGMPAALVVAIAKGCLSTLHVTRSFSLSTPGELMEQLNRALYDSAHGRLLLTLCLARLDARTGLCEIANAGHEFPLWAKSAVGEIRPVIARGERLGDRPDSRYRSTQVQLAPGDRVLLFSDGVTETQSPQGMHLGRKRLKSLLSETRHLGLAQAKQRMVETLTLHTAGKPQKDDVAFVLFSWKGKLRSKQVA